MPEAKNDQTPADGDPKPGPKTPAEHFTRPDDEAGKKALDEERKARRDAERAVAELQGKLKELDDKDKSETEKLADRLAAAEKRADEADARVIRAEVAAAKGLTPAQAKRLTGSTREELEADAAELLETFAPRHGDADRPNPTNRPKEDLRGGGDPTQRLDPDMRKLVAEIPRS